MNADQNSNNNDLKDSALLGICVKNFTSVETLLKYTGSDLDDLVSSEEHADCLSIASKMYLHLTELSGEIEAWRKNLTDYLTANENATDKE